ncbi:MAG: hypothetical protein WC489_01015 [Patescibacteria group bacterium]
MAAKNYTAIDDLIQKYKPSYGQPKEAEPVIRATETGHMQEAVEHEVSPEVQPFIKPRSESIKLPDNLKMLGLQQVKTTQFPSYKNIKLPISDEKVITGLHAPVSSSRRWLSEFAVFLLRQAHLSLRLVKGKVIRVIKL